MLRSNYVEVLITKKVGNDDHIMLIEKDRPAWQKGKLNLPGGGIEHGETPEEATIREVKEETGHELYDVVNLGLIRDRGLSVHCLRGKVRSPYQSFKPRDGETEVPVWMSLSEALADKRLIPNLRAIIPLLMCGASCWVVTDDATSGMDDPQHTFSLTVPTYK